MPFDTIWRASLDAVRFQSVEAPAGAQVLCVKQRPRTGMATIAGSPWPVAEMWFRCNPETEVGPLPMILVGTGWAECPGSDYRYIDSIFLQGGHEVYHMFAGDCWLGDTLKSHTVHLSRRERIDRGLAPEVPKSFPAIDDNGITSVDSFAAWFPHMRLRERIDAAGAAAAVDHPDQQG